MGGVGGLMADQYCCDRLYSLDEFKLISNKHYANRIGLITN